MLDNQLVTIFGPLSTLTFFDRITLKHSLTEIKIY